MFINVYVQQMIAKLNQKLEEIVKNADTGKQYLLNQHVCDYMGSGTQNILYWEDDS